jgi:pyruvate/2-oxoglutarate dehydrogenase complex dihydrolipoamide acyltransferase (E2) component
MGLSIVMPALGESVTEATVNRWLKQVGDRVEVGEPLVEVSTDKVDTEVASPAAGVIESLLVREDETVDIGTPIAVLADEGAPAAQDVTSSAAAESPSPSPSPPPVPDPPVAATALREPRSSGPFLSPLVRRLLDQYSIDPSTLVGTGANGRIRRDDVLAAAGATTTVGATSATARISAAPRVRVAEARPSLSASVSTVSVIEVDMTPHDGRLGTVPASGTLVDTVATAIDDVLERFPGLAGGSGADAAFTITDTGSRGMLWQIPVLPESSPAAVSIGAVTRRAVVLTDAGEDRIAVRSMVYLALASDPRAVESDEAAEFLLAVKARLERDAPTRL